MPAMESQGAGSPLSITSQETRICSPIASGLSQALMVGSEPGADH